MIRRAHLALTRGGTDAGAPGLRPHCRRGGPNGRVRGPDGDKRRVVRHAASDKSPDKSLDTARG